METSKSMSRVNTTVSEIYINKKNDECNRTVDVQGL